MHSLIAHEWEASTLSNCRVPHSCRSFIAAWVGNDEPQPTPAKQSYDAVKLESRKAMKEEQSTVVAAPSDQTSRFASAYRVLREAIALRAFPGCAFGVLANGQVLLQDALGRFTYDEEAPAVTAQTVFDVASLTKVVSTTAAAMLLHQRGLLDFDFPLGEFLPGFVVGRAAGDQARLVTIRHLLAHNSGLPGYVEFFRTLSTPAALYHALLELPLQAAPGERVEYSDPGFILLGKALEVVTRDYLAVWSRKEIFEPLHLTSTLFCPPASLRLLIPPTEEDSSFRHRRIQGEVQDEHAALLKGAGGHAGLFSNVPDLLRVAGEILNAARSETQSLNSCIFQKSTIDQFAERQGPPGSSRALGWDTPSANSSAGKHFSPRSIGHLGFSGCSLWIDLDAAIAVVLLTNRTWPDRRSQLIREVRPAFHNALRESL
jgi:serine-type D-Ala-D-Ala carboxypeptidase